MIGPAILVAHGARGGQAVQRTGAVAHPTDTVVAATADDFAETARGLAGRVPGNTQIEVVHVVDPREASRAEINSAMQAVITVAATLPALHFRQWLIALVGDDWDDDELYLLELAGESGPAAGLFVVGRSSEARGLLTERDEIGMASDLAYVLSTTGLGDDLHVSPHWTAGVSAVIYRRRLLVAALAAYFAIQFFDETLLAPVPATQPFGEKGLRWPQQAELGGDRHIEQLSRGPIGGSVLSDLAVSDKVFEDTPYEFLSDALQSYFEQLAVGKLARVKEQIDRNHDQHLAQSKAAINSATVSIVRESLNFEATKDFLRKVDAGLAELVEGLVLRYSVAEQTKPDLDEVRSKLEVAIQNLPYPAAVAARCAGFAALGIIGYLLVAGLFEVPPVVTPIGLAVGALLALALYGWYRQRVARVTNFRHEFLHAVELRLRAEAELYVIERAISELTTLREYVLSGSDGPMNRLRALREQIETLRELYVTRAEERSLENLFATPYSVFVPDPRVMSTAALSEQFPLHNKDNLQEAIMRAVLPAPELVAIDLERTDTQIVDVVAGQVENRLWPDLGALMRDAPTTFEQIENVLSTKVSPLLRRQNFVHGDTEVRRFLFVGDSSEQSVPQTLQASVDFDGNREHGDSDAIAVVALRDATVVAQAYEGDRDA